MKYSKNAQRLAEELRAQAMANIARIEAERQGLVIPPLPDLRDELVELDSLSGSPRRHPIRDFLRRVGRAIRKWGR